MLLAAAIFGIGCLVENQRVHASEIAYLGLHEGVWQAWVLNEDGSSPRRITRSPSDKVRVSWYPDGERLFVNAANGSAFSVDIKDSQEQQIDISLSGFQDAVLSPNGGRFAFSLSTSGSVDDNNIWLASLHDQGLEKLTGMSRLQHEPVWSTDGKSLYFLSGDGDQSHDIWRLSLSTREPRQITANRLYHFDIAASPDGTLAFSNNRDGAYNLWLRFPDGAERRLTDHPALDARPSWSPDGQRLVFESSRDGGPDLWILDIESGQLERLTYTQGKARYPVWRREGSVR